MIISGKAIARMAKLKAEAEEEEKQKRLAEDAIHKYSICPYCGEDLGIITLPSKKNTFFKTYIDGVQKVCKKHGILFELTPYERLGRN